MKQFIEEFKKFIARGNVIDLAIGVLIGGSFGKIVSSLVNDIIMPTLGMLLGKVDFTQLQYVFPGSDVAIRYGAFIQTVVDFLIIALVVFIVIKAMNRFIKKKEEVKKEQKPEPVLPSRQEVLLEEIRDLLRVRR
jgi:large conductance mechanosensitive channel